MTGRRGRKTWWRLALAGGVAVAVGVGGSLWLFGGSVVECDEAAGAAGPELRCSFTVAASPEAVWRVLTVTGEPQRHWFDAVLEAELRVGGRWRFVNEDRSRLLAGGAILELEPGRRFVQSFRAADLDDPASRITVDLEDVPGGCQVLLVHDGFEGETRTYRRFRRAHPLALSALEAQLETGRLPLRARVYTALFKPGMNLVSARAEPWEADSATTE